MMKIKKMELCELEDVAKLFYQTVHLANAPHYTERELFAWAPKDLSFLKEDLVSPIENQSSWVAIVDDQVIGFSAITNLGLILYWYVDRKFQNQGVGFLLLQQCLTHAKGLGLLAVHVYASITAKPLLEKYGFILIGKHMKSRQGVYYTTYHMINKLK